MPENGGAVPRLPNRTRRRCVLLSERSVLLSSTALQKEPGDIVLAFHELKLALCIRDDCGRAFKTLCAV